jgi:hypothetical protein
MAHIIGREVAQELLKEIEQIAALHLVSEVPGLKAIVPGQIQASSEKIKSLENQINYRKHLLDVSSKNIDTDPVTDELKVKLYSKVEKLKSLLDPAYAGDHNTAVETAITLCDEIIALIKQHRPPGKCFLPMLGE